MLSAFCKFGLLVQLFNFDALGESYVDVGK